MNIEEMWLTLARFAREEDFDVEELLRQLAEPRVFELATALAEAIVHGQATPPRWRAVTSRELPRDFTIALGTLWDRLVQSQFAGPCEGTPSVWSTDALRLWAYTDEWFLLSQDEDLMLMRDELMPGLLEIAREQACPKRDYILSIVAHWARDHAFATLGSERFAELVTRAAGLAPAARAAGAADLAQYLERLGTYALPGKVNEAQARQRGLDLTRCQEPDPATLLVKREGQDWVVVLPGYTKKTIRIAHVDGRIRV